MKLTVENIPDFGAELMAARAPAGVNAQAPATLQRRSVEVVHTINWEITIDITRVTTVLVTAWLLKYLTKFPDAKLKIDGDLIPVQPKTIERDVSKKIGHEKSEQQQ